MHEDSSVYKNGPEPIEPIMPVFEPRFVSLFKAFKEGFGALFIVCRSCSPVFSMCILILFMFRSSSGITNNSSSYFLLCLIALTTSRTWGLTKAKGPLNGDKTPILSIFPYSMFCCTVVEPLRGVVLYPLPHTRVLYSFRLTFGVNLNRSGSSRLVSFCRIRRKIPYLPGAVCPCLRSSLLCL